MRNGLNGFSVGRCSAIGWAVYHDNLCIGTIVVSRWGKSVILWDRVHPDYEQYQPSEFVTRIDHVS